MHRTTHSDRYDLPSGVPQGSVLSPLLFNVVMADLPQHLHKNIHISMYADDICLWTSGVQLPALQRWLQDALDCTVAFLTQRGMDISPEKTVFLPFTRKKMNNFQLQLSTQPVQRVSHHRFLGVIIDAQLTWAAHTKYLKGRADARINILRHLTGPRWGMSTSSLLTVHRALIQQMAAYHLPVLNNICATSENILQGVLARSLKVCLGVPSATSNTLTIAEAKEPPFEALRVRETVRHYLRLCTQHDHHPLVRKLLRRNSSFLKALSPYRRTLPTARPQQADPHPPWTLQTPPICTTVPGINQGKSSLPPFAMRQYCLELMERHKGRVAIFTDGSTTLSGSASAFVIPEHKREGIARLSHRTSSTAAELVAVQLAMSYLATLELPAQWIVYCDSKAGLQAISSFLEKGRTASTVRDLLLGLYNPFLRSIDPLMEFVIACHRSRKEESLLLRLRLNVARTPSLLFNMGRLNSPNYIVSGVEADIPHQLLHSQQHLHHRNTLRCRLLQVGCNDLSLAALLGPVLHPNQWAVTAALFGFL
ncbi:uncharacterized protein LOC135389203 [Ornithodoros turicata]|uniref:uncharacterized protein LOC135389203 n=1 Tax=Ornithodoros turicata TaxID=34597 RepID=UPI0031389A63